MARIESRAEPRTDGSTAMEKKPPEDGARRRVSLSDPEAVRQVLVDSIFGLWDVVNDLTRIEPPRRERFRVSIFGSARLQPGSFGYEATKRAAAALAEMHCDI